MLHILLGLVLIWLILVLLRGIRGLWFYFLLRRAYGKHSAIWISWIYDGDTLPPSVVFCLKPLWARPRVYYQAGRRDRLSICWYGSLTPRLVDLLLHLRTGRLERASDGGGNLQLSVSNTTVGEWGDTPLPLRVIGATLSSNITRGEMHRLGLLWRHGPL